MISKQEPNSSAAIKSFTGLYSWEEAHCFVLSIYKIIKKFPSANT